MTASERIRAARAWKLHPHLASSARWHGKRVAAALARGEYRTARYERKWFERTLATMTQFERDEAETIYSIHSQTL